MNCPLSGTQKCDSEISIKLNGVLQIFDDSVSPSENFRFY